MSDAPHQQEQMLSQQPTQPPPRPEETPQAATADIVACAGEELPTREPKSWISGAYDNIGRRPTMEDTHVTLDDLNPECGLSGTTRRAFYAIFDGHGGLNSAVLAADFLHKRVVGSEEFSQGKFSEAMSAGFKSADASILSEGQKGCWNNGCTAVCALIVGNKLFLANAGDAEAVLAVTGEDGSVSAQCISQLHKPFEISERARIEKAGGAIFFGRVQGVLAVSRALGDMEFKHPWCRGTGDFVSSVPNVNTLILTPANPFIILGCDGVWDQLKYHEAVTICANARKEGKTPEQAAAAIAQTSLQKGSMDNVTCVVIYLDW